MNPSIIPSSNAVANSKQITALPPSFFHGVST